MSHHLVALVLGLAVALSGVPRALAQDGGPLEQLNTLQSLPDVNRETAGRQGWCMPVGQTFGHTVVRLHTQLMVAGLSCGGPYGMPDARDRYARFTNAQERILVDARREIEQQARLDRVDQTAAYDALRTEIANLEADIISQRGVELYCTMRESRFATLIEASTTSFRDYARDVHGRNTASGRQCLSMVD